MTEILSLSKTFQVIFTTDAPMYRTTYPFLLESYFVVAKGNYEEFVEILREVDFGGTLVNQFETMLDWADSETVASLEYSNFLKTFKKSPTGELKEAWRRTKDTDPAMWENFAKMKIRPRAYFYLVRQTKSRLKTRNVILSRS